MPNPDKSGADDLLASGVTTEQILATASEKLPEIEKPGKGADLYVKLAIDAGVELWQNTDDEPFATVPVREGLKANLPIEGSSFRSWLGGLVYRSQRRVATGEAIKNACETLAAEARFGEVAHPTAIRVGHGGGEVWLNLADDRNSVVRISPGMWCIESWDSCPVKFVGSKLKPLPMPLDGGSLEPLAELINLDEEDLEVVKGFLISLFMPVGTFGILFGSGGQGCGKTVAFKMLRDLVDPTPTPARSSIRDEGSLRAVFKNNFLVLIDNQSKIPEWLSDTLCTVACGGAISSRELYKDSNEHVVELHAPVMITGIPDLASRPDLSDRGLFVEFRPLVKRLTERQVRARFEELHSGILGALLDRVAAALQTYKDTIVDELPRLSDLATWVTASEPEGRKGRFISALSRVQAAKQADDFGNSTLARALDDFLGVEAFVGSASELIEALRNSWGPEKIPRWGVLSWQKSADACGSELKRIVPILKNSGIEAEYGRTSSGRRWRISRPETHGSSAGVTSVTPSSTLFDQGEQSQTES